MQHLKKSAKRILYRLSNKNFKQLREFGQDQGKRHRNSDYYILKRLIEKGLVARSEFGDGYYLTDEGKKVADKITQEIDEYKRW